MNILGSRPARILIPVLLGALLAWHPNDPAQAVELEGLLSRWNIIHLGLLVALPLLVLQLLHSLRHLTGPAAATARAAAVVAAAFYAAFESLVGLGTGILVRIAGEVPDEQRQAALEVAQRWWEVPTPIPAISTVAIIAWVVTLTAAAIAHHRAGAPPTVVWPLVAAGWIFAAGHPGMTGAVAMLALALAGWFDQPAEPDVTVRT